MSRNVICHICGKHFIAHYARTKRCSPLCSKINKRRWDNKWRKKHKKTKENEKKCIVCNRNFISKSTRHKLCSEICRNFHRRNYMRDYMKKYHLYHDFNEPLGTRDYVDTGFVDVNGQLRVQGAVTLERIKKIKYFNNSWKHLKRLKQHKL